MMKRELQIFFTAIMFYTRIPCPKWVNHDPEFLNLATRYFPLIGWIAGLFSFSIFLLGQNIFGVEVGILLSLSGGVLLTGAFHEDGFADVCDGFGGGWTKEKILLIMKDSRVGTYGVVGLILLFSLKFFSLAALTSIDAYIFGLMLVTSHSLSRMAAVAIIFTTDYARDDETSKVRPVAKQLRIKDLIIAVCWAIIPFVLLIYFDIRFFLIIVPVALVTFYLRNYYVKWIGGYTGDCLGATQQITETTIYLSLLAIWRFI